jgi:hypothetical protein
VTRSGREAAALRSEVSRDRLQRDLDHFSTLRRDTGGEGERQAAEYVVDQLRSSGVEAEILWFDSLISWPLEGTLAVLDEGGREVERVFVRTRSFGAQTRPGGVTAELVHVPFREPEPGAMIFSHRAVAADYVDLDVRGTVVLTMDGGPDGIRRAQERGAAGHVHIWPSDEQVTHEMIGTSVWGTLTPESAPTGRPAPASPSAVRPGPCACTWSRTCGRSGSGCRSPPAGSPVARARTSCSQAATSTPGTRG